MCMCEAYFRQSPEDAAIHVGHARTVQRLLRGKQNHCYFLSVKLQPELLSVVAIKIRTMHLVDPTLCPCCPVTRNMQLTSAPPCHLTKASNQRQREPVWWCSSLANSPLMQEALPLSAGFQSSSNHWWWLWCTIELMAHCCFSPFSSTWAGGHG